MVSVVATIDNNALALAQPRGFSARMSGVNYDTTVGKDHSIAMADLPMSAAGTAAMPTWIQTVNAADRWAGISFALRAAAITLTANATDTDGTITQVQFFNGTTLIATSTTAPYTFNWTNVAQGTYSITARATDNNNATTTSAPVTITVNANVAPTVSLTSPQNNASYAAPASISLTANATDTDGTITQVQFFANGNPIGTVSSAPYNATWAAVPAGTYVFTAVATDNGGLNSTSAAVTVTVNAAAPAGLYFIHPDHLNTPRLITDANGTPVWRWDNDDPFGNNTPNENPNGVGQFTCNLRLPGQYFDRETGLHYNYFRDYDPSIGRYIQSDPIGLRGGINTYAYVDGDPISLTDPLGLIACGGRWVLVHTEKVDINPSPGGRLTIVQNLLPHCRCFWLCSSCDTPSLYDDPRLLPSTLGTWVFNPRGNQQGAAGTGAFGRPGMAKGGRPGGRPAAAEGIGGGNDCLCANRPGPETGCHSCTPNFPGPFGVQNK